MTEIMLSIVIPVRDEAGNIGPLLDEVAVAFDGLGFEIICVDDGSTDSSADEIRAAARRHNMIRLLEHDASYGQSAALWSAAGEAHGTWIATIDGDGQNDPRDLRRMWDEAVADAGSDVGMVAGTRQGRQASGAKILASRIANRVRGAVLRDDTPDTGCGLKMIDADAFRGLPYFNHMHRFLPALITRGGARVVQFPVGDRPRRHGRSKYGIWDRFVAGIVDLFGVYWLIRRGRFPRLRS